MDSKYVTILVTAPSAEEAGKIANTLVSQKLAAAVNILPGLTSIYTWEAEIFEESEVLMIVKTRADLFNAVAAAVQKEHSYEVPAVIALPILAGAANYLDWIDQVTRKK